MAPARSVGHCCHLHSLLAVPRSSAHQTTAASSYRGWQQANSTHAAAAAAAIVVAVQVCNLAWSKNVNELVSAHGYSQNQIIVWKYPSMAKLATLTGHSYRVLYLAVAPDGQTIVTGAGDETLRFWSVFPGPKAAAGGAGPGSSSGSSLMRSTIR